MFFQTVPPTQDTLGYLILGLIVAAIVVVAFVASLVIRYRNLQQDIKMIEQLNDDQ